ncbi:unnamed protein product [Trichobilharzia regenti]|nr:unnamed protein product [Trichobilharzia regenti]
MLPSSSSPGPDGSDNVKVIERNIFDIVRSEAGDLIEQVRLEVISHLNLLICLNVQ